RIEADLLNIVLVESAFRRTCESAFRRTCGAGLKPCGVRCALAIAVAATLSTTSCRPAPPPHTPASIILITIDTLRADHVSERLTPSLIALSRDAVVFDNVFTSAPLTLPAHASLLTALYPPRHRIHDNHVAALAAETPAFPPRLKSAGYATAAFVSAIVLDHRYGLNRGFDVYDDEIDGPERAGAETLARAERWIETARPPFFAWIHLFEPHAPYRSGSYAGDVSAADGALAGFFRFLHEHRLWDEAAISVTADHGEALGDHGEQTHGFFVYDATLRIPWILKAPGLRPGHVRRVARIVDQLPTIVAAAGGAAALPGGPSTDGIDLLPFLSKDNAPPLEAYAETFLPRDQFGWSELRSVRTGRLKYIQAPDPELYDVIADPGERANDAGARRQEAAALERTIAAMARGAPPEAAAAVAPDPLLEERLLSLGYIGSTGAANAAAAAADP